MAKISNPVNFSEHFGVPDYLLQEIGVLNPTLNVDTRLFIDPLLLSSSSHPEISGQSRFAYIDHFSTVIRLLRASKSKSDVAWRNAYRYMQFPEIAWTCLGYGAHSVSGSGSGTFTTDGLMNTAKQIVELGVEDPDLFVALGLFEDGIGPDRISDLTTTVILPGLIEFNARVLQELNVPTSSIRHTLPTGKAITANLPLNPFGKGVKPILLVPSDTLRTLPIVHDWSEISYAASKNAALRYEINQDIGSIWEMRTREDKAKFRASVLASKKSFEAYLELLHSIDAKAYDQTDDPLGELVWRRIAEIIAQEQPLIIPNAAYKDAESISATVAEVIKQFKFLIEERRMSEELYHAGKSRPEKAAQRLFFAVAYAYCKANNLDLTPEAETGNGPVDFKVSSGFTGRVLVEIKLSTNPKVVPGYTRQLATYQQAEETTRAFYVVLDVGSMGNKKRDLLEIKNTEISEGRSVTPIIFVDGQRRPSASKLR